MSTSSESKASGPWRLVKLGGSLITDKKLSEHVRVEVLDRLAGELAQAKGATGGRLIVGHGSGSFGHAAALRHGFDADRGLGTAEAAADIQDAAARLHRRVVSALLAAGARPFSVAPGSFLVAARGRVVTAYLEPLELADELGMLPVVFGDLVCDRALGATILSTESVFLTVVDRLLTEGGEVSEVLWLGETEGVHDERGRLLAALASDEASTLALSVSGASGGDVTGGIRHRLETAAALARRGVVSRILDGRQPGLLARALAGRRVPGTVVRAATG